jgi:glycine cleavage system regulatory protein
MLDMPKDLVLIIIARDRPGLVQKLAAVVARHEGNWVDSSMAHLSGEFAGILHVNIPDASAEAFDADLGALRAEGIDITVRKGSDDGAIKGRHATFELTGSDHPGIIRDISSALATNGVSIHKLETSVSPGSMSGEPIFTANAEIILPEGMRVRDLRGRLEQIAHDLLVDITLTESADATD